jgi:hypothetical protein
MTNENKNEIDPKEIGLDEEKINEVMKENVDMSALPVYPHIILNDLQEEMIPPSYKGEEDDIVKRMQHKLSMIWLSWSDIRKSKGVSELLMPKEGETEEMKEVKNVLLILFDRTGRILCDTDLMEELKYKVEFMDTEQVIKDFDLEMPHTKIENMILELEEYGYTVTRDD